MPYPPKRRLNDAAPALWDAAELAVKLLSGEAPIDQRERERVYSKLVSAMAEAEDPEELAALRFTLTPTSGKTLMRFVKEADNGDPVPRRLHQMVKKGIRRTERRHYLTLVEDPEVLAFLIETLETKYPPGTKRALGRIISECKAVLAKPLLVRLAEQA